MKSKRFLIPLAIVIIAPVLIIADVKTDFLSEIEFRPLARYSKLVGKIGLILFCVVFAFYVIKTYLLIMKKKSFTHRGLVLLHHLLAMLRKLHPFAGAVALVLLSVHGFIFAYRIYDFELNIPAVTGACALITFYFTGMLGIALYRKPANLLVRKVHRYAAFFVLVLVIAHLVLPD